MKKVDIAKMFKKVMSAGAKETPKKVKSLNQPGIRDMRQEAIDLGSHGASEYFEGGTA